MTTEKTFARNVDPMWLPADLVFLLRPVLLGPVWTIYAAGALAAGAAPGWDLLFVSLLVSGVYVHNQLTDIESDRANGKLFLLADGHVSRRAAWVVLVVLWSAAMAWASAQGARLWLYLAALLLGVAYNSARGQGNPWKARPWAGLLANVGAHGPLTFVAGFTAASGTGGALPTDAWLTGMMASAPYATAVAGVYLATTIVDRAGDVAAGKITWAVRYGGRAAAWAIVSLVAASAASAWVVDDLCMAAAALVGLAWAALLVRDPTPSAATRCAKAAITALALAVAIRWPPMFALAAATFSASRLYYRERFSIRYPTFGGD